MVSKTRHAPRISITARRRVFDGFLRVDEITYAHDRIAGFGRMEGAKRLVMERGDSAAVLIHETDSDSILLTRQVRAATIEKGPGVMEELVAGVIEPGEEPADCIRREIEEEIGYRVGKRALKQIGAFYVSPGGTSERNFLFYATVKAADRINPDASGLASEGEDIALVKLPRATFEKRALAGKLLDAKTMIAGLWLAQRSAEKGN